MEQQTSQFVILMADDDLDDVSLVADALAESSLRADFRHVADGYDLIQYLHHRGFYAAPENAPHPDVILLDLNMPKKNGTEVLAELKTTPHLRDIPVVILTTSDSERDHHRTHFGGGRLPDQAEPLRVPGGHDEHPGKVSAAKAVAGRAPVYLTATSSTSKTRVAFGGIAGVGELAP